MAEKSAAMAAIMQNVLKLFVLASLEKLLNSKNLTYQVRKRIILIREKSKGGQRRINVIMMRNSNVKPRLNLICLDFM